MEPGSIIGSERVQSIRFDDEWTLRDDRSGFTQTFRNEPNEDDIKCFNRGRGYSSSKIITKDEDEKLIVIRPVDKSG